jgi:ubiquinone/menaquinone biosynthesis C-methylase UbiE
VTPPSPPPEPVANPFAASGVGASYDRGRPFHHPRSLERIRAIVGTGDIGRALDVACGTGMSTVALAAHASSVVGVDRSPEMLRAARRADGVRYLLGSAERMPFRAGLFGAVTCCSGVHWFDQEVFFAELHRVLRPGAWVGLYDHYFIGEMVDVPAFGDWFRDGMQRYPLPPRNPQVGDPRSLEPAGFEKVGEDLFADDIAMTHAELTDYALTISNLVDAVERGIPRAEIEAWSLSTTAPMFAGVETRTIRFLGTITCFRREP